MKHTNSKTNNFLKGVSIFAFVFIVAVIGQTISVFNSNDEGRTFTDGVTINRINVSGLTKDQASRQLSSYLKQRISEVYLTIEHEDKKWEFTGEDFEVQNDAKQVIDQAFTYQQKLLNNETDYKADAIVARGMSIDVAFDFLFKDISEKMDTVISEVEKEPINSKVTFDPENEPKFTYSKAQEGIKVDKIGLLNDIERQFKQNHKNMQVSLSTITIDPNIDEEQAKENTKLISTFSTSLYNSKLGRLQNVAIALNRFNGLVVKPDEEISFNSITGPQTLNGGYKKSIIIFNGKFVEGVGGGLCQASTTLYNALVLADLEIMEVSKHTLPVGYIELALDAMVSENWSDLKFKNTSKNDVYFAAYVKDERAYVQIFGKTLEEGIQLKRRSEFIRTIPHPGDKIVLDEYDEFTNEVKYKGERYRLKYPSEGYEAKAYLQYYKEGELVKEQLIRHEEYEAQEGIIIEGKLDPPEDYEIGEQEKVIPPQKQMSETSSNNVSSVLIESNPPRYNP
jgi:vancomycin resistance protein YoaR